jgi:hypothetical protein
MAPHFVPPGHAIPSKLTKECQRLDAGSLCDEFDVVEAGLAARRLR